MCGCAERRRALAQAAQALAAGDAGVIAAATRFVATSGVADARAALAAAAARLRRATGGGIGGRRA